MAIPAAADGPRIAGAPISWGVCEVPGWGHQLGTERVLGDMQDLGLAATELGPPGFLAADPEALGTQLAAHGLRAVGGFLAVVAHDPVHDPLPLVDAFIDTCQAVGGDTVVLAAVTGTDGYEDRPDLDELGWKTLLTNLDRAARRGAERGMVVALHPHVGTMVETEAEVDRVLAGSVTGLCVDTGHLTVGGVDPVALSRSHPDRVSHVHLKDVDADLAGQVRDGRLGFGDAVRAGLWVPLGHGDVDVAGMLRTLRDHGYTGWYVLEQDVMLAGEPDGPGPAADVAVSLAYVREAIG